MEGCPSCTRYQKVVDQGVGLLRDTPPPRLREDFADRLRHSIYTLEDRERTRRHRPHGPSGGGAMAVVAAAVVVVATIWTPILFEETPSVDLPAIVVSAPEGPMEEATQPSRALTVGSFQSMPSLLQDPDLWTGSNSLLYEHSILYQRSRNPNMVRTGLH